MTKAKGTNDKGITKSQSQMCRDRKFSAEKLKWRGFLRAAIAIFEMAEGFRPFALKTLKWPEVFGFGPGCTSFVPVNGIFTTEAQSFLSGDFFYPEQT